MLSKPKLRVVTAAPRRVGGTTPSPPEPSEHTATLDTLNAALSELLGAQGARAIWVGSVPQGPSSEVSAERTSSQSQDEPDANFVRTLQLEASVDVERERLLLFRVLIVLGCIGLLLLLREYIFAALS